MLKELLPTVLNSYYISCVTNFPSLEGTLGEMRRERDGVREECRRMHRQHGMLMADYEQERKEKFAIKVCALNPDTLQTAAIDPRKSKAHSQIHHSRSILGVRFCIWSSASSREVFFF